MKVGTENRTKVIAAIVLVLIAVVLLGNWIFSSSGTPARAPMEANIDTPLNKTATPSRTKANGKKSAAEAHSLDPRLRLDWLKTTEDTKYAGNGRNIFQTYVEIPKPIAPVATDRPQAPAPPPGPPPPPPINLSFFGFASRPGEAKKIFLSEGEDIFIAGEGQIVDRRYKVLHISPNAVEIEDVLNNNRQSIPLTQG
jgi:hypothetical protein